MASKSKIAAANRKPKFSSRKVRRCKLCGRPRAVYRPGEPWQKPAHRAQIMLQGAYVCVVCFTPPLLEGSCTWLQ